MKVRVIRLSDFYLVQLKYGFFSSWDTVHKYSWPGNPMAAANAKNLAVKLKERKIHKEEITL